MTTPQETKAAFAIVMAVADTVRELGRAPRGVLYSALMSKGCSKSNYDAIERTLLNTGLVSVAADCLVWRGPKVGAA